MKFPAIFLTLLSVLTAITYVPAFPEFVKEDHPAAREIIDRYGSGNVARDDEGVLYRRFQAGYCVPDGRCKTATKFCSRPKCGPKSSGFPCTCD